VGDLESHSVSSEMEQFNSHLNQFLTVVYGNNVVIVYHFRHVNTCTLYTSLMETTNHDTHFNVLASTERMFQMFLP